MEMKHWKQIFFRGLITLLPIALTVYILYSAVFILENLLGSVLKYLLPDSFYIPGLGFVLTLGLIFAFGLTLNNFILSRFLENVESKLTRVPFIKAVYSPLKDLMNLFTHKDKHQFDKVVLVTIGGGVQALGIVTRENFSDLHLENLTEGKVSVFIPYSYGMGGFTLLVSKENLTPVNIPIEKAMSLAITGWVKNDISTNTHVHNPPKPE